MQYSFQLFVFLIIQQNQRAFPKLVDFVFSYLGWKFPIIWLFTILICRKLEELGYRWFAASDLRSLNYKKLSINQQKAFVKNALMHTPVIKKIGIVLYVELNKTQHMISYQEIFSPKMLLKRHYPKRLFNFKISTFPKKCTMILKVKLNIKYFESWDLYFQ